LAKALVVVVSFCRPPWKQQIPHPHSSLHHSVKMGNPTD